MERIEIVLSTALLVLLALLLISNVANEVWCFKCGVRRKLRRCPVCDDVREPLDD